MKIENKTYNNSKGIGFIGLLSVALIVLKILNLVEISWFMVLTSPIWIGFIVCLIVCLFISLSFAILWIIFKIRLRRQK